MPTIKGTASVSDDHAMTKLLKTTKFPSSFSQTVNRQKVHTQVMTQWIEDAVISILGFEDEIVSSMAVNLFLGAQTGTPEEEQQHVKVDPRRAQLDLAGFLGDVEAASFARELWELMLDAQTRPAGIPKMLLERKKEELRRANSNTTSNSSVAGQPHPARPSWPRFAAAPRPPEMNRLLLEAQRRADAALKAAGVDRPPQQPHVVAQPRPVSPPTTIPASSSVESSRRDGRDGRDGHHSSRTANNRNQRQRSSSRDARNRSRSNDSRRRDDYREGHSDRHRGNGDYRRGSRDESHSRRYEEKDEYGRRRYTNQGNQDRTRTYRDDDNNRHTRREPSRQAEQPDRHNQGPSKQHDRDQGRSRPREPSRQAEKPEDRQNQGSSKQHDIREDHGRSRPRREPTRSSQQHGKHPAEHHNEGSVPKQHDIRNDDDHDQNKKVTQKKIDTITTNDCAKKDDENSADGDRSSGNHSKRRPSSRENNNHRDSASRENHRDSAVEARDLTVNVTTVLPDLPEESAHVHGAILYRNRHGIAAAVVAGGVTIVTAVNVADVHDEVEAEAEATAAVCLPDDRDSRKRADVHDEVEAEAEATAAVCLPVVTKAAKIAGDAAIEITHVNGHVRNPEIRNLATEEDAGAGVPLPAKAVAVALARVTTGAAAEIRIIAMVIVKQKMMIDRNTRRTN
eukprot:CAMPEP_0194397906 /NCGR_PEP_ID=MMETSP0174-20130528/125805_1 /TAXON_ID=216777 /ORGANISM="Proboscia alata, Strain PI-D3" /LENGTH=679 /DNA_ID=CAMNT_0039194137 /DNA_START=204 /DNA_END=2245 /DNA_ORIENTATION=-